ncbi:MAG: hypothetical protein E6767_04835 [Dysgonomonas sp.]|nr:hypothetical protein [Dysgonomonas sp.]
MKNTIALINQIEEIQQRLKADNLFESYERNFNRLFNIIEEEGYTCKNPLGEKYNDSRTDCEANIVGKEGKNMVITQVIKPIIYKQEGNETVLVQKGIVIIEKK